MLCSFDTLGLISEKDSNGNGTPFFRMTQAIPFRKMYHGNQTAELPCFYYLRCVVVLKGSQWGNIFDSIMM